jgi:4'-phosphopantetheinyl transferase
LITINQKKEKAMIHIFYTKFNEQLSEEIYNDYLKKLPQTLITKNKGYKFWEDRHRNLFGVLLLIHGIKHYKGTENQLNQLEYNPYGRPFLKGKLDFNISHSGDFVVCAMSDERRVGVDIEEHKELSLDGFKEVLSKEERAFVNAQEDSLKHFFNFWSMKESIVKADGRGMLISLNDIAIRGNKAVLDGREWHLQEIKITDRASTFLAYERESEIVTKYVDFYKTES